MSLTAILPYTTARQLSIKAWSIILYLQTAPPCLERTSPRRYSKTSYCTLRQRHTARHPEKKWCKHWFTSIFCVTYYLTSHISQKAEIHSAMVQIHHQRQYAPTAQARSVALYHALLELSIITTLNKRLTLHTQRTLHLQHTAHPAPNPVYLKSRTKKDGKGQGHDCMMQARSAWTCLVFCNHTTEKFVVPNPSSMFFELSVSHRQFLGCSWVLPLLRNNYNTPIWPWLSSIWEHCSCLLRE